MISLFNGKRVPCRQRSAGNGLNCLVIQVMLNHRSQFETSRRGKMKNLKYLAIASVVILILGSALQSFAADIAGRTVFHGKEIILYDDGTWTYDAEAAEAAAIGAKCFNSQIIGTLRICYDGTKYKPGGVDGWEFSIKNGRSTFFAGWVAEGAVVPLDSLGEIILETAASAATGGRDGIAIRRNEPIEILGFKMRALEFYAEIKGIPVTFLNYHGPIEERGTVQLVFFTTSDSLEPFRDEIAALLAGTQID